MFSSSKRLKERTRKKDLDRFDYLQALVTEFQEPNSPDDKEQVLANLANFAYDPVNYDYLRQLQTSISSKLASENRQMMQVYFNTIIDLFVDCLAEDEDINGKITQFGIAGLCNLTADPQNRDLTLETEDSIRLITRCLSSAKLDTVISALTTLMQLIIPTSRSQIITGSLIKSLDMFAKSLDKRISNLATLFLEDYVSEEEKRVISSGTNSFSTSQTFLSSIPLPPERDNH